VNRSSCWFVGLTWPSVQPVWEWQKTSSLTWAGLCLMYFEQYADSQIPQLPAIVEGLSNVSDLPSTLPPQLLQLAYHGINCHSERTTWPQWSLMMTPMPAFLASASQPASTLAFSRHSADAGYLRWAFRASVAFGKSRSFIFFVRRRSHCGAKWLLIVAKKHRPDVTTEPYPSPWTILLRWCQMRKVIIGRDIA
jgi:hypothetical protein